jgi:hypothetical protein
MASIGCNGIVTVIAAWWRLPPHVRQAVLTLVESVVRGKGCQVATLNAKRE